MSSELSLKQRQFNTNVTRSSAIAKRPRSASCCWVFWLVAEGLYRRINMVTFANLGSAVCQVWSSYRPSRSEDTVHLVCQLSIYNSFPVIRTTIAKKSSFYVPRPSFFLFALETPLRWSRKTLHKWKDNSVLAKSLAAGTHLSSTVS